MLWEAPSSRIAVTGECGDQIFGSQLLEARGPLGRPKSLGPKHFPRAPPLSTFKAAFVKSELRALYEHGLDAAWEDHCKRPWSLALGLAWRGHRATCFAGHGHREAK